MRSGLLWTRLLVFVCLADGGHVAMGQTYIHRYQFDAGASVLNIGGGFAGFNLDYQVRGSFGLVVNQLPGQPMTFGFRDVRARLVGDVPFHDQSLDALLRMSTWQGVLSNPFTIDFTGWDNQHAPIKVAGTLGNVVLQLAGSNDPPCCDYLEYRLDATAHIVSLSWPVDVEAHINLIQRDDAGWPSVHTSTIGGTTVVPEPSVAIIGLGVVLAALWSHHDQLPLIAIGVKSSAPTHAVR